MAAQAVGALGGAFLGYQAAEREQEASGKAAGAEFNTAMDVADRKVEDTENLMEHQTMAFLKSGVTLEGSPLMVLNDTLNKGLEDAKEIRRVGVANASNIMHGGRARMQAQTARTSAGVMNSVGNMYSQKERSNVRNGK